MEKNSNHEKSNSVYGTCNTLSYKKVNRGCRGSKKNSKKETKDMVEYMQSLNFKNLDLEKIQKIRNKILGCKNISLRWFIKYKLNSFLFNNEQTKDLIIDLIKYKLNTSNLDDLQNKEIKNKEFLIIKFKNKLFDKIGFNGILKECENTFPLKNKIINKIAFAYEKPLKNIICNYNYYSQNLNEIGDEECYCKVEKHKKFVDEYHGHIVTGNLNIIEDTTLKQYMKFGSKFRMESHINVGATIRSFSKELDLYILKCAYKYTWPIESFREWKHKILKTIRGRLKIILRSKKHTRKINSFQLLKDNIQKLKRNFIITTVDKANNNFAIICKVFYKKLLKDEYTNNDTYDQVQKKELDIKRNILSKLQKLKVNIYNIKFPYLFVTVKFHKTPTKFRFVTCNTKGYNKKISCIFFNYLNVIAKAMENMENDFCIIYNNKNVIDFLNKENSGKPISTFDFENLFTSIPHNNIIEICKDIYNEFNEIIKCTKEFWLKIVGFCIFENILSDGTKFYKQAKGIPMGCSYSSLFANIFLYYYERKFLINNKIKIFRYVDDILVYDCNNFEDISKEIYPKELVLKKTSKENTINFLDLNIKIENNSYLIGLYDKRLEFNFKVNSLTYYNSNISNRIFKNIIFAQINRIIKICNNYKDLYQALKLFEKTVSGNGFPDSLVKVCLGLAEAEMEKYVQ